MVNGRGREQEKRKGGEKIRGQEKKRNRRAEGRERGKDHEQRPKLLLRENKREGMGVQEK